MGPTSPVLSCVLGLLLLLLFDVFPVDAYNESCDGGRQCLRCDEGGACVKCPSLIVMGSRRCVDACPAGYAERWSTQLSYMGRVCAEVGYLGLPGRTLAIVVGTLSGALICIGALLGGFIYLKRRKKQAVERQKRYESEAKLQEPEDTPARREFLKHLAVLRSDAPVFLAMLNDTRKQVRDLLHTSNNSESAIQAYRPVLRDLARILVLLNRREENILSPPLDWETLLSWGERVLRRYKRQNPHQVTQAQLVNFLQVPIHTNPSSPAVSLNYENNSLRKELTTFQPPSSSTSSTNTKYSSAMSRSSNQSIQELAISSFNNNYNNSNTNSNYCEDMPTLNRDLDKYHSSPIDENNELNSTWEFNPTNYTILAEWSASRDYLVEDFFTLGFRPQDEITTEL